MHFSKVRSLTLDSWEPELVKVAFSLRPTFRSLASSTTSLRKAASLLPLLFLQLMCELGNTVINSIYEARIEEMTIKKPHPSSPR